jgi:hypothetical protein
MIHDPQEVRSRDQFSEFAASLSRDLHDNFDEWENPTLERFLEAMAAYALDAPGSLKNSGSQIDPERPSWELFALILAGARVYE